MRPDYEYSVSLLEQSKYLYLRQLTEPRENSLRIVVEQAIADRSAPGPMLDYASPLQEISRDASPIRSTPECKTFELIWDRYVAYLVTNESVSSGDPDKEEAYSGNVFREYTKSHFLKHLSRDTDAHFEPVHHYKLICLNHIIDIASYRPAKVRLLESTFDNSKPN